LRKNAGRGSAAIATSIIVTWLKRMIRLYYDVGVNLTGAAIIIDLLERLDRIGDRAAAPPGRPPESADLDDKERGTWIRTG
jgi:MerR HTH family regulatory protein